MCHVREILSPRVKKFNVYQAVVFPYYIYIYFSNTNVPVVKILQYKYF